MFQIIKKSNKSFARVGVVKTPHGNVMTPCFMPIATKGAVKNLTPDDLKSLGADLILGNTYHLWLRPGVKVINKVGGLHKFMNWSGPILTDSGGYQVFSLENKIKNQKSK
jgi:queuine tRNA-ribosyltransferase